MKKMKITVITVCFNVAEEIERTMRSVLDQTYDNIEYIIVDGSSTDKTVEIAEDILKKYNARNTHIVSEPDHGIFDAMNKGINKATGDYINFMNVGDIFYDNYVINKIFENLNSCEYGVVFGDQYVDKIRKKTMTPFIKKKGGFRNMGICHQCIFVRSDLAKNHPFDMSYKVSADYNMIMTLYKEGVKFLYLQIPVSIFDMSGYSSQNRILQINETARICGVYGTCEHKMWIVFTYLKIFVKNIMIKIHLKKYIRTISDFMNSTRKISIIMM